MAQATYHPLSPDLSMNINLQEYFLQGSVPDANVSKLRERLKGLCDNVAEKIFKDHERTFVLPSTSGTIPVNIIAKASKSLDNPALPWQLRYIGPTETSKPTMTRSNVTTAVSDDPSKFLEELGFVHKFRTDVEGYFYRKGRVKIVVAKMVPYQNSFDKSKVDSVFNSHLVEVSSLSSSVDKLAMDEVRSVAQLLAPLVMLEKLDHRQLQRLQ